MSEIAIVLKNVSKCYKRYARPVDRLKEVLLPSKSRAQEFWALRNINLKIPKGETIGIIGQNGSGKSTLLQIIAGTLTPTEGDVCVNGRVSALLELGSGFNPEFTGQQNVFFNGQLLGLTKKDIEERFDEIAGFADIGDFLDQPVKTYSSGMFVRLAFAVAIHVDPEVLIVDEALSVGDGVFVHRCMAKIKEFQDSGGTILFVSHDIGAVNRLCSSCIWINNGDIVERGIPGDVSKSYQAWMYQKINERFKSTLDRSNNLVEDTEKPNYLKSLEENSELRVQDVTPKPKKGGNQNSFTQQEYLAFSQVNRFGTGRCEIVELEIFNEQNQRTRFVLPGEILVIQTKIFCHDSVERPIVGVTMFDRLRVNITAWNTNQYNYQLPHLYKDRIITIKFKIKWPHIKNDNYTLEPAIADGSQENHEMLDWLQSPISLQSGVTDLTFGLLKLTDIKISHDIAQIATADNKLLEKALS